MPGSLFLFTETPPPPAGVTTWADRPQMSQLCMCYPAYNVIQDSARPPVRSPPSLHADAMLTNPSRNRQPAGRFYLAVDLTSVTATG